MPPPGVPPAGSGVSPKSRFFQYFSMGIAAQCAALYGADAYLPFTWDKAWRALAQIAFALTLAAGIILNRMPGRTTAKYYLSALGLIAGLIGVLLVAGFLAP